MHSSAIMIPGALDPFVLTVEKPIWTRMTSMSAHNRWVIAAAGVIMQIALGAVYAWSVFRIPLTRSFGWTISEVTLTFTIAIFVLGLAAFGGGL